MHPCVAMEPLSRTLVFLLLTAVTTAPLAAQGLPPTAIPHERPAGCHEDGQQAPVPGPTSHTCCQVGHHPAILQQSFTSRASLAHVSAVVPFTQPLVAVAIVNSFRNLLILPGDPPITVPLRI